MVKSALDHWVPLANLTTWDLTGVTLYTEEGMRLRRCADEVDCGYDNRDSELFCRACGLPL